MLAFEKGQEVLGPYQVGGPMTVQASVRERSGGTGTLTWPDLRERRSDGTGTRG